MNKNVTKQELLRCIDLTKELFLKVGYNTNEELRVNSLAESIASTWKKEFTRWDINVLEKKTVNLAIDSDIEKFTARTVLRELRNMYSGQFPKSKSSFHEDLDRRQLELNYFKQVIGRIEEKRSFPRGSSWRHLSLFHLIVDKCKTCISPDKVKKFLDLRQNLKQLEAQSTISIMNRIGFNGQNEKPKRSRDEAKIIDLANEILIELGKNKNDVIKLLSRESPRHFVNPPAQSA
ncbi:hypothetical protein [Owenweeksia hongkongensis]|uniref:hypothetical protein n=1 Tax=Owenweeksia hongkongensis TaxID=253245 RepID=UPI003A8DF19B